MDGSAAEHSDSDSGESWTLLENTSTCGDDAPDLPKNTPPFERVQPDVGHDEDTDGISIISDSDAESSPCDLNCDKCRSEESRPTEHENTSYILNTPLSPNINRNTLENEDDFLRDNNGKHKTYIHRRNKRLSTMLNIIMLGSIITAAGVAIGHMWGAKNECTMHTVPSINKILSNLYKLQEENAFLRNKLKELTLAGHIQLQQKRFGSEKIAPKQQRCKKMFEEPLHNKLEKGFKCLDNDSNKPQLVNNIELPLHEKEFLEDLNKVKAIYHQNKSWLDSEIAAKMKRNPHEQPKNENNVKQEKVTKTHRQKNLDLQIGPKNVNNIEKVTKTHRQTNIDLQIGPKNINDNLTDLKQLDMELLEDAYTNEKKVSYADSLKTDQPTKKTIHTEEVDIPLRGLNHHNQKKKSKNEELNYKLNSVSEEEFKKDDRYTGPRTKQERKKYDRQKLHKKQKRKNKYEQWEMKGGYLKDYDEFSIASSLGADAVKHPEKRYINPDFETYINQITEPDKDQFIRMKIQMKGDKGARKNDKPKKLRNKDIEWFEKRSALRAEARKRLEQELFGETTPGTAGWYFRRMQKREQCRAQKDNSTFKKFSKQKLNFKMKR